MILLFGLAGSGKSTQGQILAQELGWKWLSVGEVLRNSGRFNAIMARGELVDDTEVIHIMEKEILRAEKEYGGVILDGYPRDVKQAEWMVEHMWDKIAGAIYLEVPKDELLKRLVKRGRRDDKPEAIKKRFEIVEQNIYSILHLLADGKIPALRVDGVGTIEEVAERMREAVGKIS